MFVGGKRQSFSTLSSLLDYTKTPLCLSREYLLLHNSPFTFQPLSCSPRPSVLALISPTLCSDNRPDRLPSRPAPRPQQLFLPTMPALPNKQARRKGATPVTKQEQGDVWRRILDVMGLEPLRENQQHHRHSPTAMDTDSEAAEAMAAPTPAASAPAAKKVTILDLPSETQKDIFKHVSSPDPWPEIALRWYARVQC